jgi:hypothetical protein
MKKYLPAVAILFLLLSSDVFAQSVTIDLTGGYCAPIAPGTRIVNAMIIEVATPPFYYTALGTVKTVSYGQGGNVALGFNWYSRKNIGFGLKLNAMIGSPFSYSSRVVYIGGDVANFNFTDKPFCFQFIPHFSFRHEFKVVNPVIEAGMIIGIASIKQSYDATHFSDHISSSTRDFGGVMMGFYTSAGLSFNVSKVTKIMFAVTCSAGSYSPKRYELTEYTFNGVNQLPYLTVNEVRGEYINTEGQAQSSTQTGKRAKYSAAFSNVGFNAGMSFVIGAKKNKTRKLKEKGPDDIHSF